MRAGHCHCVKTARDLRAADRREPLTAEGDADMAVMCGWLGPVFCFVGVAFVCCAPDMCNN